MSDLLRKLAERLARVERAVECVEDERKIEHAEAQDQLDRRLHEFRALIDERFLGDRREAEAIHNSLKETISKVEDVTDRRFDTAGKQADGREKLLGERVDKLDLRIQAVERGDAGLAGARARVSELRASTVAVVGAVAAAGLLAASVVSVLITLAASGAFG